MLLIFLSLSGCSRLQTKQELITPDTIPLLKPIAPARRVIQNINVQWQENEANLLCVLELNQHRIAIAGLTPQGMSLFNLSYDGNTLDMTQSPLLPKQVSPENIVKDVQLAFWPVDLIQKQLSTPWRLVATDKQRHLFAGNQLIAEVNVLKTGANWPETIELINHRFQYKLLINNISYEALPE